MDRLQGGGKKGQKKQDTGETSSSESDAFADMFLALIQKDSRQGNSFFQTLMQLDEGVAQETIDKMKQAIAAEAESFGIRDLSFEAVEHRRQRHSKTEKARGKRGQPKKQNGENMKWRNSRKNKDKS